MSGGACHCLVFQTQLPSATNADETERLVGYLTPS